jgi:hypothetical protein
MRTRRNPISKSQAEAFWIVGGIAAIGAVVFGIYELTKKKDSGGGGGGSNQIVAGNKYQLDINIPAADVSASELQAAAVTMQSAVTSSSKWRDVTVTASGQTLTMVATATQSFDETAAIQHLAQQFTGATVTIKQLS